MKQFRGTGVALVTPFRNGQIDFGDLERIIEFNIDGGVDYLVSLGTTGEAVNLTERECQEILSFTVKIAKDRVPVVAGLFGDNNTMRLVDRLKRYDLDGIAAVMSASPHYVKPNQEGIFKHFIEMEKASPLPIILYNVPGRTASNMLATTILRLANASEKFIGVKEASGDIVQAAKIIRDKPDNFLVLSGDDPTALGLIACGGDGVISVIANAFPREFSDMIRLALKGQFATAAALNLQLINVHEWLYVDGNPVGIKAALEILGYCTSEVRLPLSTMSPENLVSLRKAMNAAMKSAAVKI
ncbi:MAG: 4-hydroxy-tetrahydrodipicolinate synthase [Bacteroidota bacterium]